jgi:Major Facilitator Superfamily
MAGTSKNVRALLRGARFRRLLGVRLISQFSDALFQGGLAGSLLFNPTDRTGPLAIATGFAVLLLPYSLIGPYVGVVLDRWSRRTVIYACNLTRAVLVLPAAWYIWHNSESAGYVISALLVIGVNRLMLSGLSAAQPHVVPERLLVTANALASTLGTLLYSLGLGTTVLLLNTVVHKNSHGYALLAASACVGYLASALLCWRSFDAAALGPDDTQRAREPVLAAVVDVARGMVAGVRHLVHKRGPAYGLVAQSLHRALYGVLTLATLLLFRRYFYPDSDSRALAGLGEVVVVGGFGALLAAFVTPWVTRRIGGWRWVSALLALVGVAILGLGLPFVPALLVAATFVINLAAQGMKIVVDTAIQTECADEYRGRVFSVNDTLFNVCFVVGLFIAARTLPTDGHSYVALIAVSAGYLLLALWLGLALGRTGRPAATENPDLAAVSAGQ